MIDAATFRSVLGQWPSGVTVVTTGGDEPHGMTASSFSSVSMEPPLISVCIAKKVRTHDLLLEHGSFAVSILSKDQVDRGMRFAGVHDAEVTDRFDGVDVHTASTGNPVLAEALAWLDCTVHAAHEMGDHTILVGSVVAAGTNETSGPLLYHDRAWGQFADVLPSVVRRHETSPAGWTVLSDVFGRGAPASSADIVATVRAALDAGPAGVLLDDGGVADPLVVREVLQAVAAVSGQTPIGVRFASAPMALANVLVALKTGVVDLVVPAAGADDLDHFLQRMRLDVVAA